MLSADSIVRGGVEDYRDVFWLLPGMLTMGAFAAVHALHAGRAGRAERVGYWTTQVALPLAMIGTLAYPLDVEALTLLGFPLGALAWMTGLVVWGAALIRDRVLPRYAGWALILLEPASIAFGAALSPFLGLAEHGGYTGAAPKAAALLAVAIALHVQARGGQEPAHRVPTVAVGR